MRRYVIFAAIGPFLGGFWLLLTTTMMSGYLSSASFAEIGKLFAVFFKTLQYSYLFGILPALMFGAIDDILFHVKRLSPTLRVLVVGCIGFVAAELMYGSRGSDSGVLQFVMYGLVGFIPATLSSFLAHRYADAQQTAAAA
jgi:uncharacterized membrane protein YeaQ/YmgE (transglycosylase-associated protein family)